MTLSVLPIKQNSNQTFSCILPIDGKNRQFWFNLEWNALGDYWQLSVKDLVNGKEVVNNTPLCPINYPYNNIISNLQYKNIGSLYVINLNGKDTKPTYENLATDFSLVWGDTPSATIY